MVKHFEFLALGDDPFLQIQALFKLDALDPLAIHAHHVVVAIARDELVPPDSIAELHLADYPLCFQKSQLAIDGRLVDGDVLAGKSCLKISRRQWSVIFK
jgi:hypothetical protein